jgi:hypothetical protein
MTDPVMKIFNFTANDLNFNRSGMLSPQQQLREDTFMRKIKMVARIIGLILLCIVGVWTLAFLAPVLLTVIFSPQEGLSEALLPLVLGPLIAMVVGAFIFGLPGLLALYIGMRPAQKIIIEKVQGRAKVARVEHTRTGARGTTRYVKTEIHMGDRIFVVPDPAFSELEDGAEYAIYAGKGSKNVFSLEKL